MKIAKKRKAIYYSAANQCNKKSRGKQERLEVKKAKPKNHLKVNLTRVHKASSTGLIPVAWLNSSSNKKKRGIKFDAKKGGQLNTGRNLIL